MCRPQVQAPSGQAHGQPQLVHVWVDPEYAAKRQNAQHTYLGVTEDKRVTSKKKWHASINRKIKGEQRRFDRFFATEEEAAVAINTWCEQHGMTAPNYIGGRLVPASQLPAPPQTAAAGPRPATPAQRPPRRKYIPRRRAPSPGSPAATTHYGSPALAAKSRIAPTSSGSEQTLHTKQQEGQPSHQPAAGQAQQDDTAPEVTQQLQPSTGTAFPASAAPQHAHHVTAAWDSIERFITPDVSEPTLGHYLTGHREPSPSVHVEPDRTPEPADVAEGSGATSSPEGGCCGAGAGTLILAVGHNSHDQVHWIRCQFPDMCASSARHAYTQVFLIKLLLPSCKSQAAIETGRSDKLCGRRLSGLLCPLQPPQLPRRAAAWSAASGAGKCECISSVDCAPSADRQQAFAACQLLSAEVRVVQAGDLLLDWMQKLKRKVAVAAVHWQPEYEDVAVQQQLQSWCAALMDRADDLDPGCTWGLQILLAVSQHPDDIQLRHYSRCEDHRLGTALAPQLRADQGVELPMASTGNVLVVTCCEHLFAWPDGKAAAMLMLGGRWGNKEATHQVCRSLHTMPEVCPCHTISSLQAGTVTCTQIWHVSTLHPIHLHKRVGQPQHMGSLKSSAAALRSFVLSEGLLSGTAELTVVLDVALLCHQLPSLKPCSCGSKIYVAFWQA